MRVYIKHLKSGECPKGSREVRAKGGFQRCKISGRSSMGRGGSHGRKKRY